MSLYFLSLGSNIEPAKNIAACICKLSSLFPSLKISSIYETDPVGPSGDGKFWNLAALFESDLPRDQIQKILKNIEGELGRKQSENKFAPRTIDIDLLPQPGYTQQAFIMIPLAEIAGESIDPETQKSFRHFADKLKEDAAGFQKVKI